MGHEPSRFVGNAQHPVELVGRNAFLAGRHEVGSQQPLVQGDMGPLKDRPGANGELAPAIATQEHSGLCRAAHLLGGIGAAQGADNACSPAAMLQMGNSGGFIGEDRVCQVTGHFGTRISSNA